MCHTDTQFLLSRFTDQIIISSIDLSECCFEQVCQFVDNVVIVIRIWRWCSMVCESVVLLVTSLWEEFVLLLLLIIIINVKKTSIEV